jgi:hypothetical protein
MTQETRQQIVDSIAKWIVQLGIFLLAWNLVLVPSLGIKPIGVLGAFTLILLKRVLANTSVHCHECFSYGEEEASEEEDEDDDGEGWKRGVTS